MSSLLVFRCLIEWLLSIESILHNKRAPIKGEIVERRENNNNNRNINSNWLSDDWQINASDRKPKQLTGNGMSAHWNFI